MRKAVLAVVFTLFFFLMQLTVMPLMHIGQAEGSLLWAWIAVTVVSLDKRYAFCVSGTIGLFAECTVSSVTGLSAVLSPAVAMLLSIVFADMSEKKREKVRVDSKARQDDLPALLRIPLCAACTDAVYRTVLLGYVFLIGNGISFAHITRAVGSTLYTVFLTLILMVPLRKALGIRLFINPLQQNTQDRIL